MKFHELKTDPQVFSESWDGKKNFEIRFDDRDYQVGDILILKETESDGESMKKGSPLVYTGRQLTRVVNCITTRYGLLPGWCILGVSPM